MGKKPNNKTIDEKKINKYLLSLFLNFKNKKRLIINPTRIILPKFKNGAKILDK